MAGIHHRFCQHGSEWGLNMIEQLSIQGLNLNHQGCMFQWIGLGENLQENPTLNGKNHGIL